MYRIESFVYDFFYLPIDDILDKRLRAYKKKWDPVIGRW